MAISICDPVPGKDMTFLVAVPTAAGSVTREGAKDHDQSFRCNLFLQLLNATA
ncbi:MAG TPA: hypothetical protein VLV86_04180 [Vicinamibacterales bacterium]|nr:hypothetical protein [Vicinamibacterales bacterium]